MNEIQKLIGKIVNEYPKGYVLINLTSGNGDLQYCQTTYYDELEKGRWKDELIPIFRIDKNESTGYTVQPLNTLEDK